MDSLCRVDKLLSSLAQGFWSMPRLLVTVGLSGTRIVSWLATGWSFKKSVDRWFDKILHGYSMLGCMYVLVFLCIKC